MRPHDGAMPGVDDVGRGDVKTPPLWHTAAKMPVGPLVHRRQFPRPVPADGVVDGARKGSAVRRARAGRDPDDQAASSSRSIRHLRPPRYPYEIDGALAEQGQAAVLLRGDRLLALPRRLRRQGQRRVAGRAHAMSAPIAPGSTSCPTASSRRSIRARSPREGALEKSRGYAATPLTGVWANYPYLHNGSVPTLYHLLGPASERPAIFEVMARAHVRPRARRPAAVRRRRRTDGSSETELFRRFGDDRNWFNTARPGSCERRARLLAADPERTRIAARSSSI